VQFVGPGAGWQACRTVGVGRMSEPPEIVDYVMVKLGAKEQLPAAAPPHFTP
jgi:phosphopantothenoylcysteine synthetase/decarboxylase